MGLQENQIQHGVMQYLSSVGFLTWRNHVHEIRLNGKPIDNPNRGQPHVWAVKNGRLLGVEVKPSEGRLSDEQRAWIDLANKYSIPIVVVHSVGELRETLAEIWDFYFQPTA